MKIKVGKYTFSVSTNICDDTSKKYYFIKCDHRGEVFYPNETDRPIVCKKCGFILDNHCMSCRPYCDGSCQCHTRKDSKLPNGE